MTYEEAEPALRAGARKNFWLFLCYMDYEFFHERRFFLKEIALVFQRVVDEFLNGRGIKVAFSMPPRGGKSYLTSLFAAYWLGRFPELSVMRNTCTASLYEEFSYATRQIVKGEKYQTVFPEVRLSKNRQNLASWSLETSRQCAYFGAGVGGNIIGKGANLAITDDLYSGMTDALSDTTQASTRMWKQSEHNSRMEKNCPEIYIGTRWTMTDVIGDAINSGQIDHEIRIPALRFLDGGWVTFCDDVKTTEEYLKIKNDPLMDEMVWLAEYMQEPIETKGLLLPKSELAYDTCDFRKASYRFGVVDPANTGGDKFALPFCAVFPTSNGLKVYVLDALCNVDGIMANTLRVIEKCREWGLDDLFIEANGVGLASVVDLQDQTENTDMLPFTSSENKDVRILSNYEFIRKFFVFPTSLNPKYEGDKGSEDFTVFFSDLTTYIKNGKNLHKKDAIDVLCRAASIVKLRFFDLLYRK